MPQERVVQQRYRAYLYACCLLSTYSKLICDNIVPEILPPNVVSCLRNNFRVKILDDDPPTVDALKCLKTRHKRTVSLSLHEQLVHKAVEFLPNILIDNKDNLKVYVDDKFYYPSSMCLHTVTGSTFDPLWGVFHTSPEGLECKNISHCVKYMSLYDSHENGVLNIHKLRICAPDFSECVPGTSHPMCADYEKPKILSMRLQILQFNNIEQMNLKILLRVDTYKTSPSEMLSLNDVAVTVDMCLRYFLDFKPYEKHDLVNGKYCRLIPKNCHITFATLGDYLRIFMGDIESVTSPRPLQFHVTPDVNVVMRVNTTHIFNSKQGFLYEPLAYDTICSPGVMTEIPHASFLGDLIHDTAAALVATFKLFDLGDATQALFDYTAEIFEWLCDIIMTQLFFGYIAPVLIFAMMLHRYISDFFFCLIVSFLMLLSAYQLR